jgi:2-polyprenyl-3-methyl-5-hydroxy-6-metoxy-1,4-benzoquinol methylase
MAAILLDRCPICNTNDFSPWLSCEDYTSSHETFTLVKCASCSFVVTNPRPNETTLPNYYLSDQYISHSGKTNGIIGFLYLWARTYTLQWKLKLIQKLNSRGTLLDYGCGTGQLLAVFKKKGWDIAGVEPSASARQQATKITGIKIANQLNEHAGQQFDIITLWHVLEHISDLRTKLAELKSLLKSDGTLLIAVPNLESSDAKHYKNYWAGYDVPRHLWHFSKSTITSLVQSEGLHVTHILPMKLDAFYVSLLSEKYKRPKSNSFIQLIRGIARGLNSNYRARKSGNYSSLIYIIQS